MKSSYRIEEATYDGALQVAVNLRSDDRREIQGLGHNPFFSVLEGIANSDTSVVFYNPQEVVAGIAGVCKDDDGFGLVWMLCTRASEANPLAFVRHAKRWLASHTEYPVLHNIADPRNVMHLKLLKLLGFKKLGYVSVGPRSRTYVEFAKIMPCVNLSP